MNPSDLGTRGIAPNKLDGFWFKGPAWLSDENWPDQPEIPISVEALKPQESSEDKVMIANEINPPERMSDVLPVEQLVERFNYRKLLRLTAWLLRYKHNLKNKERRRGFLQTNELVEAEDLWIKCQQLKLTKNDKENTVRDTKGIYRVNSRIVGYQPILLPRRERFTERLIEYHHVKTLHGGVAATMSKIRERYWIPQLRRIVKSLIYRCNLCKRFRKSPLKPPRVANLPTFRTQFGQPFETTGVDFAGPILYKNPSDVAKGYIALFTCATTRAVHLKFCESMAAETFQHALKEFVARRGTPKLIVSDNAKTFKTTEDWLKLVRNNEEIYGYLDQQSIEWNFNLSRAPWWGGFFERLIGIMKRALSKQVGNSMLSRHELEDVLLDIECFMNNRPLCYVGEEVESPVLTPNILLRGTPTKFLEAELDDDIYNGDEYQTTTRRMKYLQTCRNNVRKRWQREYLHALEERHKARDTEEQTLPKVGSVVLIAEDNRPKTKWVIGRIMETIKGKDHVVRGFKIKKGNGFVVERPVQLVKDLEIQCDLRNSTKTNNVNNVDGDGQQPRRNRTRKAKTDANDRIVAVNLNAEDELFW